jgi:hypothetical protein
MLSPNNILMTFQNNNLSKLKLFLFIGLYYLLLASCEKTSFMELPYEPQKMVINGIMTPDYGFWINLVKSAHVYNMSENRFEKVNSATIDYYENGNLIKSVTGSGNGDYYETDFKPQAGNEYKFIVNAAGLPETSTIVHIPKPVEIIEFDTTTNFIGSYYYDTALRKEIDFNINLKFDDPDSIENYYMLGAAYWEDGAYRTIEADCNDICINTYTRGELNILACSDNYFNGETKELAIKLNVQHYEGFGTRFRIIFYSIEEEYFKYLRTYAQNHDADTESIIYQEVMVSSNIEGGLGIMAAVSSSVIHFDYIF